MASFAFLLTSLLILPAAFGQTSRPVYRGYVLLSGESLIQNEYLERGSNCQFIMQTDCNLVLYEKNSPTWASQTSTTSNLKCQLLMQSDGNLVLYDDNGNALWHSNTATTKATYPLIVQSDCNVVIYGPPRWSVKGNN